MPWNGNKLKNKRNLLGVSIAMASLLLASCGDSEPKEVSDLTSPQEIAQLFGDKLIASTTMGAITINVYTQNGDGKIPIVDEGALKGAMVGFLEAPIDLRDLNKDDKEPPTKEEMANLVILAETVQQDLRNKFQDIIDGKYGNVTWDIVIPDSPDMCITKRGFEKPQVALPDTTNCDWQSPNGITLTSPNDKYPKIIRSIIAPSTINGEVKTSPFSIDKPVIMNSAQVVGSTEAHEWLHAILSFVGITDYMYDPNKPDTKRVEEAVIQLLEYNGISWIKSQKTQPFTWLPEDASVNQ